jgi:hypothetical protein
LEPRVGGGVATLSEYVPLLSVNSVNAGLFDTSFAAVVKAVKSDLVCVF